MRKTYLFLALIWTLIITYLSLSDVSGLGSFIKIPHKDKMAHFVFYFLFCFLWIVYFSYNEVTSNYKIKVLISAVIYGILMEFLQAIMHNHRSSDVYDVVANTIGAFAGYAYAKHFVSNKKHI